MKVFDDPPRLPPAAGQLSACCRPAAGWLLHWPSLRHSGAQNAPAASQEQASRQPSSTTHQRVLLRAGCWLAAGWLLGRSGLRGAAGLASGAASRQPAGSRPIAGQQPASSRPASGRLAYTGKMRLHKKPVLLSTDARSACAKQCRFFATTHFSCAGKMRRRKNSVLRVLSKPAMTTHC